MQSKTKTIGFITETFGYITATFGFTTKGFGYKLETIEGVLQPRYNDYCATLEF